MKYFLVIVLIIFIFIGCGEEKVKPEIDTNESKNMPIQESWNSKIIFSQEGRIKAVLFTQHLEIFDEKNESLLEDIKIEFYDSNNVKTTTLTALRGKVDDLTKNMYAIENVIVANDSGVVLTTDELMWRNSDEKIITDKFVKIVSNEEIIEGYGLVSDQHLKNYVIKRITYSAVKVTNEK
ncbi:MAG: LPS export ABC transporter periplasmic protein LptC [Melioribacteraceae bacterium]|nr:LPS export ABC transporter periplasmic protein LptC [Melioribacteraceae bacterium]